MDNTNKAIVACSSVIAILMGVTLACGFDDSEPNDDLDIPAAVDKVDELVPHDAENPEALPPLAAGGDCATMFEDPDFGGDSLDIPDGAAMPMIEESLDDEVSSIVVEPGCTLYVWEYPHYGGSYAKAKGKIPWVGNWWNDKISSYKCGC